MKKLLIRSVFKPLLNQLVTLNCIFNNAQSCHLNLYFSNVLQEEYMDQETLNGFLQPLIQCKMDDVCNSQNPAYYATSSLLAPNMFMSTLDLRHNCNSDTPEHLFSHPNASTEYETVMVDNTDSISSFKGLTFNGYQQGASHILTASNKKNIPLPTSIKTVDEMILSPEQDSTITTCSGDGFADVGSFNNGPVFDSNLQIPQLLQMIPEVPSALPSMGLDYHQPYVQFDKPSEAKSQSYFNENELAEQVTYVQTQLPSEPSYWVPVASEISALSFSSRDKYAKPSNLLHFLLEHKILRAYISYKSSVVPIWDGKISFMNFLHSTICTSHRCGCEQFCILLSHFEDCHSAECCICGPAQYISNAGNYHKFDNMKRNVNDRDADWPKSGSLDCLLPSSKRLKKEHPLCSFSSEVGISSLLDPLEIQPSDSRALPPLQQWPESPISINSKVMEVNMEPLRNPAKDSTIAGEIGNSIANIYCMLNSQEGVSPEELICGSKMEEINVSVGTEMTKNVLDSNRLRCNAVPVLCEELHAVCKEDNEPVRIELNLTNSEIENEPVAVLVRTELDLTKAETENEFVAQEADYGKQIKSRNPWARGVSLTEFFTAEQIRVHISSLRHWIIRSTSKEEKGNKTTHVITENSCQLCGADKLSLSPTPIYCASCSARIKCNLMYYSTPEENGMRHCFCTLCYKLSRGGKITSYGMSVSKAKMDRRKNDEATEEVWVLCDKCEGWQHQICGLFNNKRDVEGKAEYICPKCCLKEMESGDRSPLPKSMLFGAKDLPSTMLSDHIEQRLFNRLQQEREKKAKVAGKNLDEVPTVEGLVVRVVLSVDRQLKVKQQFLDIFHHENYPTEFPYRSKVILLFQKIEGVDVCLFGMYVQEFGSECGHPNQRCVYISYLDSVKYFRPMTETATGEAFRTFVYHEILMGYLEYCKKRGFATCFIWACPPVKGEDYILYCHPEIQKTPKSNKLRQWYRSMLRKAAEENIVVGFTNLYDHFFIPTGQCNSKVTAAHLPYFDGEYWYGVAEGVIKSIERQSGDEFHKKMKKPMTKRTLKAMGHADPTSDAAKDILFMKKLGETISPVKEDFIVVHLQFACTHCHEVILNGHRWVCRQCKYYQLCERCHHAEKNINGEDVHIVNGKEKHVLTKAAVNDAPSDTKDKDVVLENSLFENRNAFLSFCQKNYYQFDTLRRAKYSSMMILHHLQNLTVLTAGGICSFCYKNTVMDQCWICEICPEFEVCAACYKEKSISLHVHKLTQRSCAANSGVRSIETQQKALQTMQLMDLLQHASKCHSTKSQICSYRNCLLMKKLFHHLSKCNVRAAGSCRHCKKAWLILVLHSKKCTQSDCGIPRCKDLKKHAEEPDNNLILA